MASPERRVRIIRPERPAPDAATGAAVAAPPLAAPQRFARLLSSSPSSVAERRSTGGTGQRALAGAADATVPAQSAAVTQMTWPGTELTEAGDDTATATPQPLRTGDEVSPERQQLEQAWAAAFVLTSQPKPEAGAQTVDGDGRLGQKAGELCERASGFILHLVACASPDFQSWSATVPMPESVLPQTTLQLEFAPHWLRLRFQTQSAHASRLICHMRGRLLDTLTAIPSLPPDIDLDLI